MTTLTPLSRVAFLGGFEPRRCGIATFTTDLTAAVGAALPGARLSVGAVNDDPRGGWGSCSEHMFSVPWYDAA